jgi:hypothetical protein
MKKSVLAICLVSLLSIKLEAQTPTLNSDTPKEQQQKKRLTAEERAKKDAERAEKKLALTADQKVKWEAAALVRAKANQPLKEKMQGSTTPEERKTIHKQVKTNNTQFETTVETLLTLEQKQKYEELKAERRKHKGRHAKGHSAKQQGASTQ